MQVNFPKVICFASHFSLSKMNWLKMHNILLYRQLSELRKRGLARMLYFSKSEYWDSRTHIIN